MSNYTKTVNFATKDALTTGDANKIVKGTEIDTEFNNIAVAIATKLDSGGVLAQASGGTGATSLTGAGIVTTGDTQTITAQKTFTGQALFTGAGSGASFGVATPSGDFAAFFSPRTSGVAIAGAGFQNNGGNEGAGFATNLTATALIVFGFGTATTPGSIPQVGAITTNGTTTAYVTSSDYRLKTNVAPLANAVTRLKLLQPKNYTWISAPEQGVQEGFIAHELQAVVPDAVFGQKDEVDAQGRPKHQGVDTSMLVALLTAALQDAITRIEALEAA